MSGNSRLVRLKGIIENAPKQDFGMNAWKCGTVYCAFGHACLDEEFIGMGLEMIMSKDDVPIPAFEGNLEYRAAMAFFNIDRYQAYLIFNPSSYTDEYVISKESVIKNIEFVIKKRAA